MKKKITKFQEGVAMRKHELEQARGALIKDKEELDMLKIEEKSLKGLVEHLRGVSLCTMFAIYLVKFDYLSKLPQLLQFITKK